MGEFMTEHIQPQGPGQPGERHHPENHTERKEPKLLTHPKPVLHRGLCEDREKCLRKDPAGNQQKQANQHFNPSLGNGRGQDPTSNHIQSLLSFSFAARAGHWRFFNQNPHKVDSFALIPDQTGVFKKLVKDLEAGRMPVFPECNNRRYGPGEEILPDVLAMNSKIACDDFSVREGWRS